MKSLSYCYVELFLVISSLINVAKLIPNKKKQSKSQKSVPTNPPKIPIIHKINSGKILGARLGIESNIGIRISFIVCRLRVLITMVIGVIR